MSWSALLGRALGASEGVEAVTGLRVRPGEVLALVEEHQVSLIRPVWPDTEWTRVCAALASQPVFRARVLSGELPEAAARVFALLGLDLVPAGWKDLVATCACDHWRGRCPHLGRLVHALGTEADLDPFVLTRWAGLEKRSVIALVTDLAKTPSPPCGGFDGAPQPTPSTQREEVSLDVFAARTQTLKEVSPKTFWDPTPQPEIPVLPTGLGDRVRAAAPAHLADELPRTTPLSTTEEHP